MAPGVDSPGASRPNLGNKAALLLFILLLLAYVVQTQATEYVQGERGYRQPFFLFFLTHGSFTFILPLHLLLLRVQKGTPICANLQALKHAVLATYSRSSNDAGNDRQAYLRFSFLMFCLTLGVTAPSLLWYMAVSLTSISSVTALFNTNAFWTYVLSLFLLGDRFRPLRLGAVLLAVVGVVVDAYAGACTAPEAVPGGPLGDKPAPANPLLGNLLAFLASLASSIFQVSYKKYAASPSPSTAPRSSSSNSYAPIPSEPDLEPEAVPPPRPAESAVEDGEPLPLPDEATHLPFALYANFITSMLGIGTLVILWLPIPLLNASGLERFRFPPDWGTTGWIALIAGCGVTFNTIFMILLGVWGPIVTSVGSLLTTILVLAVDVALGGCVTLGSWIGCSLIAVAFAVLAMDVAREG